MKAIIEILPKTAFPAGFFEINVGRGDNPDVDRYFRRTSDTLDFSKLENTQKVHLEFERHVSDFVEHDRPVIRCLNMPDLARMSPCKRPFLIAEQLGLDQVGGNCSAVEGDEGTGGSFRAFVNRTGHKFLSGAAFSGDQNTGIGSRNFPDAPETFHHGRAASHHIGFRHMIPGIGKPGFETGQPGHSMGVAKDNSQSLGVQGKSMKIDTVFPDLMQNIPLLRKSGTQKRDPPDTGVRQGGQESKGILCLLFSRQTMPRATGP